MYNRSRIGPDVGLSFKNSFTRNGEVPRCGKIEPGTLARASKNKSINAIRMLVSCRHNQRKVSTMHSPQLYFLPAAFKLALPIVKPKLATQ